MFKISLLFQKNTDFTGECLENCYDKECETFRVLFLYEFEYLRRFLNLHWCTFKTKSNHFIQREGFNSDYSNSDQDPTRGKNVTSTAITTASTTVIINTNI